MSSGEKDVLSVCIISHNGYGAIRGCTDGFIGGVEVQTSMLARWLASRGHRVSFLTWDEGGPAEEWVDGVRVIKICRRDRGLPGLRFIHPKWTGLVEAIRKADADVYYQNCGECVTGQAALWCRRNRRRFVFSAACDTDCAKTLPEVRRAWDRWLYLEGLRLADRVLVQTIKQEEMMRLNFGIATVVVPMPCACNGPVDPGARWREVPPRVAWVGRVCPQKRPDILVEVAAACPDYHFDVVGPCYPDAACRAALDRALGMDHVSIRGKLPHDELSRIYSRSCCLLSTSDYEGFPNTFLEAWGHGLPVVSRFDPDGLISDKHLGLVADDAPGLVAALRTVIGARSFHEECSQNARNYFRAHHRMDVAMPRIERILAEVLTGRGAEES